MESRGWAPVPREHVHQAGTGRSDARLGATAKARAKRRDDLRMLSEVTKRALGLTGDVGLTHLPRWVRMLTVCVYSVRSNWILSVSLRVRSNFTVHPNLLPFLLFFWSFPSLLPVVAFWQGWEVCHECRSRSERQIAYRTSRADVVGRALPKRAGHGRRNEGKLNKVLTFHCPQRTLSRQWPQRSGGFPQQGCH